MLEAMSWPASFVPWGQTQLAAVQNRWLWNATCTVAGVVVDAGQAVG